VTPLLDLDTALRAWVLAYRTPWLDGPMLLASAAGVGGTIWLVIGTVSAIFRPRLAAHAWQLVLTILLCQFVVDGVLKPIVGRDRPFVHDVDTPLVGWRPVTNSFPSGHAASSAAGAYVLGIMWPRLRLAWWLLAALVAVSRVYVGVHYPLDVVAGWCVGLGVAVLVTGGRACYIQRSARAAPTVPR
jgi:undecaprenyl-diphosphatase